MSSIQRLHLFVFWHGCSEDVYVNLLVDVYVNVDTSSCCIRNRENTEFKEEEVSNFSVRRSKKYPTLQLLVVTIAGSNEVVFAFFIGAACHSSLTR